MQIQKGPIGIFDSGYGGLTILKDVVNALPQYDYLYLGDNARAPYGSRSFDTVYHYTWEAVQWFFSQGCELVILACNTASAKALRSIQQKNLPLKNAHKRVLGVIRPTAEVIGNYSRSGEIGILATTGTVESESYLLEIAHYFPSINVVQEACPLWVPLIENNEFNNPGADYFVQKHLQQIMQKGPAIDTLLLACTHYPLLMPKIEQFIPGGVKVISQGTIVANSLVDYLERHPEMANKCAANGQIRFCTTDSTAHFDANGAIFFGKPLKSEHIQLGH
ncbi:MAG: glutamate racemase [Sphingobacteriia bacterium]|nr:MAG: glutamate racemase [Sphingobacteriia bacterium]